MTEDLGRWVRRIENEQPPDLGPHIRGRQPAGESVPRGPRGSRAATVVGIALVTIILAAGIIVPLKALWPLAGDREGSTTPAAAAPLAVLSPAPRECPVGFGESGRRIQAEEVPALMRGHLPVWLPPGFGLAAAWEETMVSPWATWSDPTCRSVRVSFSPGGEGPSSWRTLYDKPNACGNSIMGSGRCIGFNVQASDGTVSVQTIGLSTAEAEQVVRSIPMVPVRLIPTSSPSEPSPGGIQLSACPFGVGDSVSRGDIGARVPEPGGSVSGYGDKATGGSSSIQIDTSTDGVVTITSSKNGVDSPPESCQLSTVSALTGSPSPEVRQARLIIKARPLGPNRPPEGFAWRPRGTPVASTDLSEETVAGGHVRFALADQGDLMGVAYPAVSTDDGATWQIAGPLFYYAAAQGASGVSDVGAAPPDYAYFWGQGGNAIRVTHDGGAHWYSAWFHAGVRDVSQYGRVLQAQAYGDQESTDLYVSTDFGLTWHLRS